MKAKNIFLAICILLMVILLFLVLSNENESFVNPRQEEIIVKPYDSFYAPVYSALISDQVLDKSKYEIKDLVKVTSLIKYSEPSLLDIGGGGGDHVIWLAKKKLPNFSITAMDSSKFMLEQTRKRCKKFKVDNSKIRFLHRSAHEADLFMQGTFTHVTAYYFTIYQLDWKKTIKNIHSWLKPGGWFCVHLVDLDKFDPILDASSPFIGTSLQRYTKNRITESKVHFKTFLYMSNFTYKEPKKGKKGEACYEETFKFKKKPVVRKQKHELNSFTVAEFIKKMSNLKFELRHTTNLSSHNYPFQYILYFQK